MDVTLITTFASQKIVSYYWSPLIHKYGNDEFIVIDENKKAIIPMTGNCKIVTSIKDAINQSSKNILFITDMEAIPTYQTMTILENLNKNRNESLLPVWHNKEDIKSARTWETLDSPNTFSVLKNQYNGETKKEYISKFKPKELNLGSMYYVN